jgi:hypothetical protein
MFPVAGDAAVQPLVQEPFMSKTPTPSPIAAIAADARCRFKKLTNWWSVHGFNTMFYAYMGCMAFMFGIMLHQYIG